LDKWNKQGGSNRDNINKPRKKKRISESIIRPLKSLKESDSVSPKIVAQKKPLAQYGQFGDDVLFIVDPVTDLVLPEIKINDYEYELRPNVVPIRILDDRLESFRDNKGENLLPRKVLSRYEIFIRFGRGAPILIIMPGQAYMARTGINNERFDRSLVVISDLPIIFDANLLTGLGTVAASTTNVIRLNSNTNSEYQIVDSLYRWINELTGLITDITGQSPNPILVGLNSNNAPQLPAINFTYDSELYGLFGAFGRQVDQICLAAVDTVLEFDRKDSTLSTSIEPYSVLLAGARIAVCSPRLVESPKKQYRVIAVFFTTTANGFRYGGYNEEGDSQNLISPRSLTQFNTPQNDPGFNIISPGSRYWSDITPRFAATDSDGVTTFTEPYWEFSFINPSQLDFFTEELRVTRSNGDDFAIIKAQRFFGSLRELIYCGGDTRVVIGNISIAEPIIESTLKNIFYSVGPISGVSPFDLSNRSLFGFQSISGRLTKYNGIYLAKPSGLEYKIYEKTRLVPLIDTTVNTRIPADTSLPVVSSTSSQNMQDRAKLTQIFSGGVSLEYSESVYEAAYSIDSTSNSSANNTGIEQVLLRGQPYSFPGAGVFGYVQESGTSTSRSISSDSQSFKIKVPVIVGQLTIFKKLELLDNQFRLFERSNNSDFTTSSTITNPSETNLSAQRRRFTRTGSAISQSNLSYKDNSVNPIYTIANLELKISEILFNTLTTSFSDTQSTGQTISIPVDFNVNSCYVKEFAVSENISRTSTVIYEFTGRVPGNEQQRFESLIYDSSSNSNINGGSSTVTIVNAVTAKMRSYEILESINFVIVTNQKIYSCKVDNLTSNTIKTLLSTDRSALNLLNDEFFHSNLNTTVQLSSIFFTNLFRIPVASRDGSFYSRPPFPLLNDNHNVSGFDSEFVNFDKFLFGSIEALFINGTLPYRKVTALNATIVSIKNHDVSDYLPSGQSRILIPNMAYFNPEQTILTGANPSKPQDNGLIAKLFRTTKRTQIAATVEVWCIRDNGEFDLLELLDTPIGNYPGSTRRIMYYPGDV
jgi:hypothetical protein